ncbi:hypothetical protein AJ78_07284 [Emergomyces pasteurianus Ep9510]|uniref:FYVE-type domain-containing protein n=1 Tax=Emergomyces pasteurianus Ep9510 TaxID=1447872 RepID=A0A1J9Q783_9EURO|nr:hypothetical protein AJ78_07284 [Emergomyces pasteurianus Ep9510]
MSTTSSSQTQTNNLANSTQVPSPIHSTTATPANNSPTSPRLQNAQLHPLQLQSRQLRPPKSALYVPAVLRPTERAAKLAPLTPPRSVHGSLDSLDDQSESTGPITRRSTFESVKSAMSKLAEDEWLKDENLGQVTGSPTREHWKADSASPSCDSPTCRSSFGLFLRRHHCRHCGHVFCSSHTPHIVPLDQNARFHPNGIPSRACDLCWNAYNHWDKARTTRLNEIQQDLVASVDNVHDRNSSASRTMIVNGSNNASPADARPGGFPPSLGQDNLVASSVPRDWSWSTF